ncbi:Uncharacterised protein [Anaerobiospirillum thomasii]|uniref:hypothetical protein n=1 Tax=Anaerobiospirillum thomasii TaxID=179995 RepID=UPI000DA021D5|nr:hypothetical protein [Anaerobiospirillum thomasii]SPT71389.1 Uncharacterised protein [Anaerobiospirillum thomasii]
MFILTQNLFSNIDELNEAIKNGLSKPIRLLLHKDAFQYLICPLCNKKLKFKAYISKAKRLIYGVKITVLIPQMFCENKDCNCGACKKHKVSRYHLVQPDIFEPGQSHLKQVIEDYIAAESENVQNKDLEARCGDLSLFKQECKKVLKLIQRWKYHIKQFNSLKHRVFKFFDITVSCLTAPRFCLLLHNSENIQNAILMRFRTANND